MRPVTEPFRPERPSVPELSAGAVVASEEAPEILLLHERSEDRWCFPKGRLEPGETLMEGAIREIVEETGIKELTVVEELGEVAYRFYDPRRDQNIFKTTVYYLAYAPDRLVQLEEIFDDFAWLAAREAHRKVSYDTDRRIIEAAEAHMRRRRGPHTHYG